MKKYILFLLLVSLALAGCKKENELTSNYLNVVNTTDYLAEIFFDTNSLSYVFANSQDDDINLAPYYKSPVHVEARLYNGSKTVGKYSWDYIFDKNKNYRMVITTSISTTKLQAY